MEEKKDTMREKLFYEQKQGYDLIDVEERLKLEAYSEDYKAYLNASRTEREAVREGIRQAEEAGFIPYERGMELKPGTKIYKSVRGKALMLAVIGTSQNVSRSALRERIKKEHKIGSNKADAFIAAGVKFGFLTLSDNTYTANPVDLYTQPENEMPF